MYAKSKLLIPAKDWNGLLIVGDCPYNEANISAPFMASHLGMLTGMMKNFRGQPVMCNCLPFYVPYRKFANADGALVAREIEQVKTIIKELDPKLVLFLGRETSKAFKPGLTDLDDERGAPWLYENKWLAVCTYHPAEVFQIYELTVIMRHDFQKVNRYLTFGWHQKEVKIISQPTLKEAYEHLTRMRDNKSVVIADIETDANLRITCIGFSDSEEFSITIPLKIPGGRYWSKDEEKTIWVLMAQVLEQCKLVGHNAVHFDHYVLAKYYNILPNFIHDTMFIQWEFTSELPKSLAFVNSLYLDNPYWKFALKQARQGKIDYREEFIYNSKDCIVNSQAFVSMIKDIKETPKPFEHYQFNIRVSRAMQYMAIHGMRFNSKIRDMRVLQVKDEAQELEKQLYSITGRPLNVKSPKQMSDWLYRDLRLPPKFKMVKQEDGSREQRETSDYLSLLWLAHEFPEKKEVMIAGRLRKVYKRLSTLESIKPRPNGYVGYSFNTVGTVAGRASCSLPPDDLGIQAQNQDRRDRDLYYVEDDEYMLKADLEGADSWTVAAQLASLGSETMMNDLLSGLKPAQAIGIAFVCGEHLINEPAETLIQHVKAFKARVDEDKRSRGPGRTIYDVMKAVSHGSNYGMGPDTMRNNIFKKSDGELYVSVEDTKRFQNLYLTRYKKIDIIHERLMSVLGSHGYLDSFSGQRRHFFGRRNADTVREMASFLPQCATGFVTNQTIDRLYNWKINRISGYHLLIRLLNQVHDETVGCFKRDRIAQAAEIFRRCSENKINTWGIEYSIPFDAAYGLNWAECNQEL